ncbi:MAG: hypothetical protein COA78_25315 [Blastopirellula sp.]|nr:MAG: hypothetical protein COA78_25315 [Blastopirellula sp.]
MDEELEALIQQTLASGVSPAQMTGIVFRAAQAKGISPQQLPQMTSLSDADIQNGMSALGNAPQVGANVAGGGGIPTGLIGSEMALEGGLTGGISALRQGANQARNDLGQGIQGFDPFAQAGQGAIGLQAALSGAQGADAQGQAFQDFQSSPGQQSLQQRGEQALTRNSAALGGLGGGNVRRALTEFGIGTAAQDFGNQFNRLGQVAGMGLSATGSQGQMRGQQANIANSLGVNAGNMVFNTGQNLSQGRNQFGRDLSNTLTTGAQNLSGLQNNQGLALANQLGISGDQLAQILASAGANSGNLSSQLGQNLSGVSQTASGQRAGLPGIPGVQQTEGMLSGITDAAAGIGTLMALSDRRLKKDIVQIGKTNGGANIYKWNWIEAAKSLVGNQPSFGVMADEVMYAVTVGADGFKRVDYSRVV